MEEAHGAAATQSGLQGRWVWGVVEGSNAGAAGRREWMAGVGAEGPRKAGIKGSGSGCGGLRMCDRDRGGAG